MNNSAADVVPAVRLHAVAGHPNLRHHFGGVPRQPAPSQLVIQERRAWVAVSVAALNHIRRGNRAADCRKLAGGLLGPKKAALSGDTSERALQRSGHSLSPELAPPQEPAAAAAFNAHKQAFA